MLIVKMLMTFVICVVVGVGVSVDRVILEREGYLYFDCLIVLLLLYCIILCYVKIRIIGRIFFAIIYHITIT